VSPIAQTGQSEAIHSPEACAITVLSRTIPTVSSIEVVCTVAISCWLRVLRTISSAQQRAYASDPVEQYLSFHFPGALPVERAWLRANQHRLANPALIHSAAAIALQRGCPRGSPEFMQFCAALLDQHAAAQGHAAPVPEPPPTHEPEPQPVAHIDLEAEHSGSSEPEESHAMPQHLSAPVSRSGGERYAMGDYEPTAGSIRLSAEQRDMAHRSMPHLSADEAEKSYAANLLKMQKMQKSGLIK